MNNMYEELYEQGNIYLKVKQFLELLCDDSELNLEEIKAEYSALINLLESNHSNKRLDIMKKAYLNILKWREEYNKYLYIMDWHAIYFGDYIKYKRMIENDKLLPERIIEKTKSDFCDDDYISVTEEIEKKALAAAAYTGMQEEVDSKKYQEFENFVLEMKLT